MIQVVRNWWRHYQLTRTLRRAGYCVKHGVRKLARRDRAWNMPSRAEREAELLSCLKSDFSAIHSHMQVEQPWCDLCREEERQARAKQLQESEPADSELLSKRCDL